MTDSVDNAPLTDTQDWYYPSEEMVKNSHVPDYEAVYAKAKLDPQAFWAERAEELSWYQKVGSGAGRVEPAVLQVVRRRQNEYRAQRAGSPCQDGAA